ncbi:hypothetical protein [Kitasatospora mediocidica]|uniref:hypothetical protein n=1 Tax=Kitasatospora mediocidica TaxID=58352 RepID=UPI00056AFC3F|nr:hypothetical protein [Kitasatospora mediocidica]
MDDKTAAEPLAHPAVTGAAAGGPRGRRRRALAAGALLLAVAAAVTGCNAKTSTSAAGSPTPSAPAAPSTPAGSPTTAPSTAAGAPTTAPPAAGGGGTGTSSTPAAPTRPAKPSSPPPAGTGTAPDLPSHLKPNNYLTTGNQLTVFFFGGVCDKYGLKTDESKAGQVGVSVVITEKAPAGQVCPALVKQQGVEATLSHPLQGRAVVDLDTGANVPLESVPNGGPVSAAN